MTLLSRTVPICHREPQREGTGGGGVFKGWRGFQLGIVGEGSAWVLLGGGGGWGGAAVQFRAEGRKERMCLHGEFCPHFSFSHRCADKFLRGSGPPTLYSFPAPPSFSPTQHTGTAGTKRTPIARSWSTLNLLCAVPPKPWAAAAPDAK